MKNPWVIVGLVAVVLFGGAIFLSNGSVSKSNEGVVITENIKGNSEASVVLTEYSDFQCPACAAFQPALDQVLAAYGDSIRFEYKHFPLPIHQFAINAAVAAEAAGQQGKFFEFHDALFANQNVWANATAPNALFVSYAEELGLDVEQFARQMKSSMLRDKVKDELAEGRVLQVTGTPTFYLNGEKMEINTYEDFILQVAAAVDPENVPETESTTEVNFGI